MPEIVRKTDIGTTVKIEYTEIDDGSVRIDKWWSKRDDDEGKFRRRKHEEGRVVARSQIPGLENQGSA